MLRFIPRVAVLVGLAVLSTGDVARAASWADSLFSEKSHDFGMVPRGGIVRHPFVLTNRLNEPISIINVRASCGCTSGKANASVVNPGLTAIVEAQMDTRNFVGKKATVLFVDVVTASGAQAEIRLPVQSMILADVVLNPGALDFGAVAKGKAPNLVLSIDRVGKPDWKIVKMVSASKVLTAQLVETARQGDQIGYQMTVSIKPDAPAGVIRDEIRLISNDPETASIPVPVTAEIRGDLTASPALLNMGTVASAGAVQGKFMVRASRPFTVAKVEGAGDGFKVEPLDGTKKTLHIVTISYHPDEATTKGDLRRSFRITTDLADEGPLDVTVGLHASH